MHNSNNNLINLLEELNQIINHNQICTINRLLNNSIKPLFHTVRDPLNKLASMPLLNNKDINPLLNTLLHNKVDLTNPLWHILMLLATIHTINKSKKKSGCKVNIMH